MRLLLLLLFFISAAAQPFEYQIEAFAGRGHVEDGTPALDATFRVVVCVVNDSAGNLYICTANNGGIFRVSPDQMVTRIFGSEVAGDSVIGSRDAGDGGPALRAQGAPVDAVVDDLGVVYFAQSRRVRRIGLDGIVTTFAGGSEGGAAGDGGPAVAAQLRSPQNLALGPDGSIYVSDTGNGRIRRIDPAGVISTVAGTTPPAPGLPGRFEDGISALEANLAGPRGLEVAPNGDVYFCDSGSRRVRKVSAQTGLITTVAGVGGQGPFGREGSAVEVDLDFPIDLLLDDDGGFYLVEGPRIRYVQNGLITTVAADARAPFEQELFVPRSLTRDANGNVLISTSPVVRRLQASGALTTVAGRPRFQPQQRELGELSLYFPNTVQLAPEGAAIIVDSFNHTIWKAEDGGTAEIMAGNGLFEADPSPRSTPFVPMGRLRDVAFDGGGAMYITEWLNDWIRVVEPDGRTSIFAGDGERGYSGDGGAASHARLSLPRGIAVDRDDNVYVADTGNQLIRRIDHVTGQIDTIAGVTLSGFSGDGGPAINAQFNSPRGLDFDRQDNLYIADTLNHRIRRIAPDGTITTVAGNGFKGHSGDGGLATEAALNEPHRVEADPDGYLYIGDSYNHAIRMVTPQGTIHTIGGSPLDPGDEGDGGPALVARLNLPKGLAVRPNGDVLFSDNDNHRIRVLKPTPRLSEGGVVNAASFSPVVAPDSIVSVFGTNLAGASAGATETPLPASLSFSRIVIVDSAGAEHEAGQFFASKTQINFHLDPATAPGAATLRLIRENGFEPETAFQVAPSAAGLFQPAVYLRVRADGTRETGLGSAGDEVFLTVFATGLRKAESVTVAINGMEIRVRFAGEQGQFLGFDQLDVGPLPRSLIGVGEATLEANVDGASSNSIRLVFQ